MTAFTLNEALSPIEVVYQFDLVVVKFALECIQVVANVVFAGCFWNGANVPF